MSLSGSATSLFIYFTYVQAIMNKQGYNLDRKGTWKRGKCQ